MINKNYPNNKYNLACFFPEVKIRITVLILIIVIILCIFIK